MSTLSHRIPQPPPISKQSLSHYIFFYLLLGQAFFLLHIKIGNFVSKDPLPFIPMVGSKVKTQWQWWACEVKKHSGLKHQVQWLLEFLQSACGCTYAALNHWPIRSNWVTFTISLTPFFFSRINIFFLKKKWSFCFHTCVPSFILNHGLLFWQPNFNILKNLSSLPPSLSLTNLFSYFLLLCWCRFLVSSLGALSFVGVSPFVVFFILYWILHSEEL